MENRLRVFLMKLFIARSAMRPKPASCLQLAANFTNRAYTTAITADDKKLLAPILQSFKPVQFCIGYGSGVRAQQAASSRRSGEEPMIDFIFAVADPRQFHSLNLGQHPEHYSWIARHAGSKFIQMLQENFGAGIYYNTKCRVTDKLVKYGVISTEQLHRDLSEWTTLYCAGRMHKPHVVVQNDEHISLAQQKNLEAAVRVALLLLPSRFSERELYLAITGLSYTGDFRMSVKGENPKKISNIVDNQAEEFRKLYAPAVRAMSHLVSSQVGPNDAMERSDDPKAIADSVRALPSAFKERLLGAYRSGADDAADAMSKRPAQIPALVSQALVQTVRWPAAAQAAKGIISAGPLVSLQYAARKLGKGMMSSQQ